MSTKTTVFLAGPVHLYRDVVDDWYHCELGESDLPVWPATIAISRRLPRWLGCRTLGWHSWWWDTVPARADFPPAMRLEAFNALISAARQTCELCGVERDGQYSSSLRLDGLKQTGPVYIDVGTAVRVLNSRG